MRFRRHADEACVQRLAQAGSINASSCLLSGSGTRFEHHVGATALGEIEFAGWVSGALDWFATNDGLFRAWDEATALKPEFREIVRAGIAALPDSMTRYLARWPVDRRDEARLRIELLVAHRTSTPDTRTRSTPGQPAP